MNKELKIFLTALTFSLIFSACGNDSSNKNSDSQSSVSIDNSNQDSSTQSIRKLVKAASEIPSEPVTPEQIAKAKEIIKSTDANQLKSVDVKKKYKMLCSTCHGIKGNMNVNGAKDLTKSTISLEESVAQIYHGRGLMTPFKGVLKDNELVAIAMYIESLRK